MWGCRHYSKRVAGTSERVIFPFMSRPKQKTRRVWGPLANESKRQRDGTAVDSQNKCVAAGSAKQFPLSSNCFHYYIQVRRLTFALRFTSTTCRTCTEKCNKMRRKKQTPRFFLNHSITIKALKHKMHHKWTKQKCETSVSKLFTPAPTQICNRRTTQINLWGSFDRMFQVLATSSPTKWRQTERVSPPHRRVKNVF